MPTFLTPIDVTPSTINSWEDVDEASVPDGATGVILRASGLGPTNANIGARENGSTDGKREGLRNGITDSSTYLFCGVDGSGIFEVWVQSTSDLKMELVGYFGNEATFFTNSVSKTIASTTSWLDIDISSDTGGDTATAGIFQVISDSADIGMRNNASTDASFGDSPNTNGDIQGFIIGVDGSEICEGYKEVSAGVFWLQGYLTSGVTMRVNGTDVEPSGSGSYEDQTVGGNAGAIIIAGNPGAMTKAAARLNGSSEDIYRDFIGTFVIDSDGASLIETKKEGSGIFMLEVGYFNAEAPATVEVTPLKSLLGVGI